MFSPRRPLGKRLAAAALAAAVCALLPAAVSAGVVVSASGPSAASFPVGKKLGNSERIVLRPGDTLTVLDGNGTRVLRGAGTFSLDQQAGPSQRASFAALTQRRTASQVRTGATRTGDQPPRPASLWYVDVSHPGTVCLVGTDRVRLWRPETEGDATYALRASAGGASHSATFADGDTLAPWDTAVLPITDGATFALSGPDGAAAGTLTFAVLGTAAEEPEALAQQLIEKGCTQQLEVLSSATLVVEG
jgi:hypothetical protein